jgi:hypothetical protein
VIVLTYNGKDNLKICLDSLRKQTYRNRSLYYYDQASHDGSHEYVKNNYPEVTCVRFPKNVGYAKGNNEGLKRAFNDGAEVCLVLNDDTESEPDMIEELIASFTRAQKKNRKVGLVQPTILLFDKRTQINTIGNAIHYLGFGFCKDFLKRHPLTKEDQEITSASGAAMLITKEYFESVGRYDEDFFMYNEDQNLSWRGLLKGYTHFVSARSILYHKYDFHRSPLKIYHSEKNRIMILFENYSARTLLFIFPIFFLNEIIAILYAPFGKCFTQKMSSYWYLATHIRQILSKRKKIQSNRTVPDKNVLEKFESELIFEVMKNPLLIYLINPLYHLYYNILLKLS